MFIITLNLCNAVFQAGGKIWLWKHNSNKQTAKDTLNTTLYNKNVFKRNKETWTKRLLTESSLEIERLHTIICL